MAMDKLGVTEQDIANALMGKDAVKEGSTRPVRPPSPIGEDALSKLAAHAQRTVKTGHTVGKSATQALS